jgi:hypothetical protein
MADLVRAIARLSSELLRLNRKRRAAASIGWPTTTAPIAAKTISRLTSILRSRNDSHAERSAKYEPKTTLT